MYKKTEMFKEKTPGEKAVEELAAALYKDKRHIDGLHQIFAKLSPSPSDSDIEKFCEHWLKVSNGMFPNFKQVREFMDSLSRITSRSRCPYEICEGTGFIEIKKPNDQDHQYLFVKQCKCVDVAAYKNLMNYYKLTESFKTASNLSYGRDVKFVDIEDSKQLLSKTGVTCPF